MSEQLTSAAFELNPAQDGVTHLNIYSKARTRLGYKLTNPSEVPLEHPTYGPFRTAEGLWFFLKTGKNDDRFRVYTGFESMRLGKEKETVWNNDFHLEFKQGLIAKVEQDPELKALLTSFLPELPFAHYYWFGSLNSGKVKVVVPRGHEWQVEFWEAVRKALIEKRPLQDVLR